MKAVVDVAVLRCSTALHTTSHGGNTKLNESLMPASWETETGGNWLLAEVGLEPIFLPGGKMKKHRGHHRGQVEPKWGRKGAGLHRGNNSPEHRKIAPSRGRRSRARY